MMAHFEEVSVEEIVSRFEGSSLKVLKGEVAKVIVRDLGGIRERFVDIMDDDGKRDGRGFLADVAEEGGRVARKNADETMKLVRDAMGL